MTKHVGKPSEPLEEVGHGNRPRASLLTRAEKVFRPVWEELTQGMSLPPQLKRVALNVVCGDTDGEIAAKFNIRVTTVRSHLYRLCHELGTHNRVEILLFFLGRFRDLYGPSTRLAGASPSGGGVVPTELEKCYIAEVDSTVTSG